MPAYPKSKQLSSSSKAEFVTLTCTNCETSFERRKSNVKGGIGKFERRFCSPNCKIEFAKKNGKLYSRPSKLLKPENYRRNGRSYTTISCTDCGEKFERRADQVNQRGTYNFCKTCNIKRSTQRIKENGYSPPKNGKEIKCTNCEKEFYINKFLIGRRKFCSEKCKFEWQRDNASITNFIKNTASGKESANYKHGRRVGKNGGSKPKIRREIIERDGGHWCLICGLPGPGLHLHRVIYGSQCGKYEVGNCVLLCGEHHGLVHSSKKTWQPQLLEYLSIAGTEQGVNWLMNFRRTFNQGA